MYEMQEKEMNFTDKLRQLHGEATPGPWRNDIGNYEIEGKDRKVVVEWRKDDSGNIDFGAWPDMDFICLLRNHAEQLLELLRAVEGLSTGTDWNKGTHAEIYRPLLLEAMRKLNKGET